MSVQITPPCAICGKGPRLEEEWISIARWRAGHAVGPMEIDPKTGQVNESGPGEFYGETTGHLACIAPKAATLLAPNVYSTGQIDLGSRKPKGKALKS